MQHFDGQPFPELFPELSPLLFVLRCQFSHLYLDEHLGYWVRDSDLELLLHCQIREIIPCSYKVELCAVSSSHHMSHYIETPGWW